MKRGIIAMLAVCALIGCMSMKALAAEVPDLSRQGTIRITMEHDGVEISGGSLSIHRVGAIREDDGNYSFVPAGEFLDTGIALDNIQSDELAGKLARFAEKKGISGWTEEIDKNGRVVFEELELGLYLFVQNEAAPGYQKVNPFLVSLPGLVDGAYIYEVDGSPKVGEIRETEPTVPPSTKPGDPTLPQTGQLNWPVAVMASAGMALLVVGFTLRRKK